jgi:tetratricopeptide (TPR) repeat protein
MKPNLFLISILVIIITFGLIMPNGIRAAVANNLWSVKAVKDFFNDNDLDLAPANPPVTHQHVPVILARQALAQGNTAEALSILSSQADSKDAIAMDLQAGLQYLQKDYYAAIQTWAVLGDTLSLEGAAYEIQSQGQTDLLIMSYQSLYDIDQEKYVSGLALYLSRAGQDQEAITLLEGAIDTFPRSEFRGNWHRYLGEIYVKLQNYQAAELTLQRGLLVDPGNARIGWNYHLLCSKLQGEIDDAAGCYQRLLAFKPQDPDIYVAAGLIFEKANLDQQAFDAYLRALELDPDHQGALQGSQRLSETP